MKADARLRQKIMALYQLAESSACNCQNPGAGKGFHGHDKGCQVHINRDLFQYFDKVLDSPKPT